MNLRNKTVENLYSRPRILNLFFNLVHKSKPDMDNPQILIKLRIIFQRCVKKLSLSNPMFIQENGCQPNFWVNMQPSPDKHCGPYTPTLGGITRI